MTEPMTPERLAERRLSEERRLCMEAAAITEKELTKALDAERKRREDREKDADHYRRVLVDVARKLDALGTDIVNLPGFVAAAVRERDAARAEAGELRARCVQWESDWKAMREQFYIEESDAERLREAVGALDEAAREYWAAHPAPSNSKPQMKLRKALAQALAAGEQPSEAATESPEGEREGEGAPSRRTTCPLCGKFVDGMCPNCDRAPSPSPEREAGKLVTPVVTSRCDNHLGTPAGMCRNCQPAAGECPLCHKPKERAHVCVRSAAGEGESDA